MRLVQEDGLDLACDVDAQGLHELRVRHLAVDVAGERVREVGHDGPSLSLCRGGAADRPKREALGRAGDPPSGGCLSYLGGYGTADVSKSPEK